MLMKRFSVTRRARRRCGERRKYCFVRECIQLPPTGDPGDRLCNNAFYRERSRTKESLVDRSSAIGAGLARPDARMNVPFDTLMFSSERRNEDTTRGQ